MIYFYLVLRLPNDLGLGSRSTKLLNEMIFLIAVIFIIFVSIFAVISSRNSDEQEDEMSGFDVEIIE